ncbi:MAG TPA: hypothetical protein VMG10_22925 [Gemmataceae bacterium]|nr:hypothetical protein [Gemmataceae bacterium]
MQLQTTFKNRRAVLISGGISSFQNYARYLNDLTAFYTCLVSSRYSFATTDIQVLYANGGVYDMGGHQVTTTVANRANVLAALHKAVKRLGSEDLLVLFTTNHGDATIPHRLNLWTPSEYLEAPDLGAELAKSSDYFCLGIFGHCFGAKMINQVTANTTAGKGVGVAASKTASHLLPPDGAYDAFLHHFTAALALETPSGYPAAADAKKDGHIDIQEAYDFAHAMNKKQKITDQPDLHDNAATPLDLAAKLTLEGILP